MVKTPKTRHSKSHREPVTIELEPDAVSRVTETDAPAPDETPAHAAADQGESSQVETGEATVSPGSTDDYAAGAPSGYDFSSADDNSPGAGTFDQKAEATSEPAQAKREARQGGLGLVAAGIVGGVIALAGAGALQFAGILPAANSSGASQAPDSVQTELAQLKQAVAGLEGEAGGPDTELTGRVDALSQTVEQLRADTSALKQAVETAGGDNADLRTLETRLTEAEASIAALRQQGSEQPAGGDVAALGEKLAGLEALVGTADETAKSTTERLGTLEQTVGTLSGKVEAQEAQPKIALSIAASALKSAVDRGAPFEAELETFAAIAPDAPEIQPLRAYAGQGVPSRNDLANESDAAVKAIIAAAKPLAENAGFFDRLLSSAESLVSVRPIGAVEGSGIPETAARMEFAVKSGNLDQALAEYESLPEPAKAAGSAFAEKIRARAEAERLVDRLVAGAMKA
ncbi:phage tail protein [Pseudaminobacter arsenicus]|uniref:Phage tail protein n=1 Tax=Borborobacter arsenicus TaxID=1851146 RepID=A0A432V880_9HYPH|nr:phage tail protein [Pseudaminobacter arsenicus]RUM98392.1 phage tail protein [Pseudaminobacter arsenicus]